MAEAANAELQTLVYSVSHDLRNPIISVLGYLDVLARSTLASSRATASTTSTGSRSTRCTCRA